MVPWHKCPLYIEVTGSNQINVVVMGLTDSAFSFFWDFGLYITNIFKIYDQCPFTHESIC